MSISYLSVCSTWSRKFKKRVGRTVHGPPNFPHAQYLDIRMLTHELIVNLTKACLRDFELYSRWVPLGFARHLKSLIVRLVFFNCDEMSLSAAFTVKTQLIVLEYIS